MAKMVGINHSIHIDPQQHIVKAAEVQHYLDFTELKMYGQQLINQAQLDAETIRQRAHAEGYAHGITTAEQHVGEKILALTVEKAKFIRDIERQLPSLVLSLVQRILNDFNDTEKLASLTQEILFKIKSAQRILIRIHSNHVEAFTQDIASRLQQTALLDCVEVEADDEVPLHQCHVEFDEGLYLLDWQEVLKQIETQMNSATDAAADQQLQE
jgi:flagellar biosynthesis/type III secretory pathway protein FliH